MGSGTSTISVLVDRTRIEMRWWKMGYFVDGEAGTSELERIYSRASSKEIDHCMRCTLPDNFCGMCDGHGNHIKKNHKKTVFTDGQIALF